MKNNHLNALIAEVRNLLTEVVSLVYLKERLLTYKTVIGECNEKLRGYFLLEKELKLNIAIASHTKLFVIFSGIDKFWNRHLPN